MSNEQLINKTTFDWNTMELLRETESSFCFFCQTVKREYYAFSAFFCALQLSRKMTLVDNFKEPFKKKEPN